MTLNLESDSIGIAGPPLDPNTRRHCQLVTASLAHNADDLRELLATLGLDGDTA